MVGKIEKKYMSNPRKRKRKRRREKGEKDGIGAKEISVSSFALPDISTPKRNVTREFSSSHVKTVQYTWYNFISQNASVLVFMSANVM